jgi:hypothetical protein
VTGRTRPSGAGPAARPSPRLLGLLFLLLLPALVPTSLGARQAEPVMVHPRPDDAVVAVAVRFPAGSAMDPESREGTAFLLGRVLETEGQRRLQTLSATLETTVARNEFTVTLRAPEDEWDRAWSTVRELLAGTPISDAAINLARESQRERLVFEAGAPVRSFEVERDRFLLGASHPGSRRLRGTPNGLTSLSAGDLNDFRSQHLRLDASVIAVVGPVTPAQVQGVFRAPTLLVGPAREANAPPRSDASPPEAPGAVRPAPGDRAPPEDPADTLTAEEPPVAPALPPLMRPRPLPHRAPATPSAPDAWMTGDRMVIDQEVTSTWIAVAWPLPAGTPAVLLDFLVHVVGEELNPSPPDPGLYRAEVRMERMGPSPVLLVNATVDPRVTLRWEERILRAMESVAEDPPRGAFFELTRRRYRASRLLEQALPEARALWLTRSQAEEGEVPLFPHAIWGLTREGLQGLAQSRGEPRILLYGPARMMEPM